MKAIERGVNCSSVDVSGLKLALGSLSKSLEDAGELRQPGLAYDAEGIFFLCYAQARQFNFIFKICQKINILNCNHFNIIYLDPNMFEIVVVYCCLYSSNFGNGKIEFYEFTL